MKREINLVKKLYSSQVEREWGRLIRDPFHRLEFDTTMKFLKRYLPKNGLILDAGGGPGRYSIELAKLGYDVVLLDLVEENLELAKIKIKDSKVENKVKEIVAGSIHDLSRFKDKQFDAVICLGGPVSHVHPEKNRKKTVSELVRVAKAGAPIFISVMGKFGTLMRAPGRYQNEIEMTNHFKRFSIKGDDYMWNKGKSYAHYFELQELKNLLPKNIKYIQQIGLEGLSSVYREDINEMALKNKKAWKNWLDVHEKLCTKPTVADSSLHFMIILKKK